MGYTVFFSWQSDRSSREGRNLIEKALEEAVKCIASDSSVDEPLRELLVDKDTKNIPGSPRIFETILSKIEEASVFVADLTFCGNRAGGGPIPNPNVLVEYGYALRALRDSCVISVMNSAHGKASRETMPFDLLNRRFPISYHLVDGASDEEVRAARKELSKDLERALRMIFESDDFKNMHGGKVLPNELFVPRKPLSGGARFRNQSEELGTSKWGGYDVFLDEGPAMWLRIMPEKAPHRLWLLNELEEMVKQLLLATLFDYGEGSIGMFRADDGCGCFPVTNVPSEGKMTIHTATFMFETGEIWTVTTFPTYSSSKYMPIDVDRYVYCLTVFSDLLVKSGLSAPFRWIAGIEGVKGWQLHNKQDYFRVMQKCLADSVISEGTLDQGQSSREALRPFFEKFFDRCGMKWAG